MSDIEALIDLRPCQWRGCGRPLHSVGSHDSAPHWHSDEAHPGSADCHTYTPPEEKESAMSKPVTVHIGTVTQLEWCADGVAPADLYLTVRVQGVGDDSPLLTALGKPIVLSRSVDELMHGYSVVRAAEALVAEYERLDALAPGLLSLMNAKQHRDLVVAVKALRAVEGK